MSAEPRLPPSVGTGTWQPMASAPRDGTTILAWSDEAPFLHVVAYDPEPPAAWVAQSGEYILGDGKALRVWAHLPGAGRMATLRDEVQGLARHRAAWAVTAAAGAVLCLLGMWVENVFDLLP